MIYTIIHVCPFPCPYMSLSLLQHLNKASLPRQESPLVTDAPPTSLTPVSKKKKERKTTHDIW